MPFLLLFTLFALLDFIVLFSVGGEIGLLATLGLILATGFIGLYLVRREGAATLVRARQRLEQGELPSSELLTGAALIFGGALLMAPGFISDALGFACILPGARQLLGRMLARANLRFQGRVFRGGSGQHADDDWQQARGDRPGADERSSGSEQDERRPLEGDYIGRDEPRR